MRSERQKPLQLIPADGWFAAYALRDAPYLSLRRLVSFALVEDKEGERRVDAIDQRLYFCLGCTELEEADGATYFKFPYFMGFHHQEDLTAELREELTKEAQAYLRPGS